MNIPVESVAAETTRVRKYSRFAAFELARILAVVVVAAGVALLVVKPQLEAMQREQASALSAALSVALGTVVHDLQVEIATPPSNDKLFTILSKGVGNTEYSFKGTSSIGTTPGAAFTTDLTTSQQTDSYTQEFTIANVDDTATDNLCWFPLAWSAGGGATCQLKCAAAARTCSRAVTDGSMVFPGGQVSRRFDGTSCLCVVGSVAAVAFQTERVIR